MSNWGVGHFCASSPFLQKVKEIPYIRFCWSRPTLNTIMQPQCEMGKRLDWDLRVSFPRIATLGPQVKREERKATEGPAVRPHTATEGGAAPHGVGLCSGTWWSCVCSSFALYWGGCVCSLLHRVWGTYWHLTWSWVCSSIALYSGCCVCSLLQRVRGTYGHWRGLASVPSLIHLIDSPLTGFASVPCTWCHLVWNTAFRRALGKVYWGRRVRKPAVLGCALASVPLHDRLLFLASSGIWRRRICSCLALRHFFGEYVTICTFVYRECWSLYSISLAD